MWYNTSVLIPYTLYTPACGIYNTSVLHIIHTCMYYNGTYTPEYGDRFVSWLHIGVICILICPNPHTKSVLMLGQISLHSSTANPHNGIYVLVCVAIAPHLHKINA